MSELWTLDGAKCLPRINDGLVKLRGAWVMGSGSTAGSNYFVRILSTLDREVLKPNTSVALHRHSHSVVEILPPESDSTIQLMQERPDVTYHDIGGMDMQKQEVRRGNSLSVGCCGLDDLTVVCSGQGVVWGASCGSTAVRPVANDENFFSSFFFRRGENDAFG